MHMQLVNYAQLEQAVADADFVLVGLGEEWVLSNQHILEDLKDKNQILYKMLIIAEKKEEYQKVIPLLYAYYYNFYVSEKLKLAYKNMLELLSEKNYFIVSLTVDSYLKRMGFNGERCVNPCGTYEKMQCEDACNKGLFQTQELMEKIKHLLDETYKNDCMSQDVELCLEKCTALIDECHCELCGADLSFNLLDSKKYLEEGYLEQWKIYMKWLQGTLNRKLCVIEAGVGMKLPSVIRWPFEKTVFYNQKANMFRIHEKFYQVNEEVAERAYGCKCHSVKMFGEKNVEA